METVQTYFQNPKRFLSEKSHKLALEILKKGQLNLFSPLEKCNEFVGLEIEIENVQSDTLAHWADKCPVTIFECKEDGSLRNNGVEYCTKPIKAYLVPYAIATLKDCLNANIEFTERTSVHVHLNMIDATAEEVLKVVLVYLSVERLLYRFVKKVNKVERANNIFCIPINQTHFDGFIGDYIEAIRMAITDEDDHVAYQALSIFIDSWQKYTGFNLLRIRDFGTIEFRQLSGTCEWDIISNWVGIITQIKKYAKRVSLEELQETLTQLNTNSAYDMYISSIFEGFSKLLYTTNYQKHLEPSTIFIKQCFSEAVNRKFYTELTNLSFGKFKNSGMYKALNVHGVTFQTSESKSKGEVKIARKIPIPRGIFAGIAEEAQPAAVEGLRDFLRVGGFAGGQE